MFTSVCLRPSVLALIALSAACGGDLGPGTEVDTFVLREVDGDPLPTVLSSNEFGSTIVVSDTIRLRPDGTGTISGVRGWVGVQDDPGEGPKWGTADIHYRTLLQRIEIDYVCSPLALCAPPPHLIAVPRGSTLEVSWAASLHGRSPMIYAAAE